MIKGVTEPGLAMTRVRATVDGVGLAAGEIEALLGLAPGRWKSFATGGLSTAMTRLQETRARLAIELLGSLGELLPAEDIGAWMRRGNPLLLLNTPLDWSTASLDNLRAMVRAVRLERDDARYR
jgi:hypothetical protein